MGYAYGTAWDVQSSGMTMSAATSDFIISQYGFNGAGFTYHDVTLQNNGGVDYNNTIHNLAIVAGGYIGSGNIFNDVSLGGSTTVYGSNSYHNLNLTGGGTYSISGTQTLSGALTANGTCTSFITITGAATISSPNAQSVTYASLQNIIAAGGGTFTAVNTIDGGGNAGWTISPLTAKNLYWIGGTGNWSNGNHWSLTSGGSPLGCTPTGLDNVFFNANSFTAGSQTVTVDVAGLCNNMDWAGVTNTPTFTNNAGISVYGSLTLVSGMNTSSSFNFLATGTGKTVTTGGKSLNGLTFNGVGGGWVMVVGCCWFVILSRAKDLPQSYF